MTESYNMHLDKNPANYARYPISFLRSGVHLSERVATVHGKSAGHGAGLLRCRRLASSSRARNPEGDTVAAMLRTSGDVRTALRPAMIGPS